MVISLEIGPKLLKTAAKLVNQENQSTHAVTKCPKTGQGEFTALGGHCCYSLFYRNRKNTGFCMSLCYIIVGLFLIFAAKLFSALHLLLRWSFGIIGIHCNVRF